MTHGMKVMPHPMTGPTRTPPANAPPHLEGVENAGQKFCLELVEKASGSIAKRLELCDDIWERINQIVENDTQLGKRCHHCGSGIVRPQIESTLQGYYQLIHNIRKALEENVAKLDLAKNMEKAAIITARAMLDAFLPHIADQELRESLIRESLHKVKLPLEAEIKTAVGAAD